MHLIVWVIPFCQAPEFVLELSLQIEGTCWSWRRSGSRLHCSFNCSWYDQMLKGLTKCLLFSQTPENGNRESQESQQWEACCFPRGWMSCSPRQFQSQSTWGERRETMMMNEAGCPSWQCCSLIKYSKLFTDFFPPPQGYTAVHNTGQICARNTIV